MKKLKQIYISIGSTKFAVIVIILFASIMVIGTFVESYSGTEYAQSKIYLSWWFILLQICMYLSILFATLIRIPYKKRLTGFYIIHAGLLTIFSGSLITYIAGIDGSVTLYPQENTNRIDLNQDVIKIEDAQEGTIKYFKIPRSSSKTNLNYKYDDFEFESYIPYSNQEVQWLKTKSNQSIPKNYFGIKIELISPFMNKKFTLVNHLNNNLFSNSLSMGPLNVQLIDDDFYNCLKNIESAELLVNIIDQDKCLPISEFKYKKTITQLKNDVYQIDFKGKTYSFYPKFNNLPITDHMTIVENSPIKIIKLGKKNVVYLNKLNALINNKGKFKTGTFKNKKLLLPWMGMYFRLIKFTDNELPTNIPMEVIPRQKDGKLISGATKAILFYYKGEKRYVTNQQAVFVDHYKITLEKKSIFLPFDLTLRYFQMNKNPGTTQPASFESFINIFENGANNKAHVYMNNPLKKDKFTFYQSSYFQLNNGQTASVFSVNYDPGRWIKYLGSLLLVIGSFLHFFYFSVKKNKKKKN